MVPQPATIGQVLATPSPASAAGTGPSDLVRTTSQCVLCAESLRRSGSPFDRVLAHGPDVDLLPALGMLVPGYFLAVAQDHLLSLAQLGPRRLKQVEQWTDRITGLLRREFGAYLVFEHGSCAEASGGSCIDHAHAHFLPLAQELTGQLLQRAPWQRLATYADLASFRDESYMYLGYADTHLVVRQPSLGSQWLRRQAGELLGTDTWDWAMEPGCDHLEQTLTRLPLGL